MNTTNHPAERVAEKDADSVGSKKNLLKSSDEELRFKAPERGAGSSLSDEQYNKVCLDLIDGHSLARVARFNDVGRNLVAAIKDGIRDQVPEFKQRMSGKLESLAERLVDELEAKLDSGEVKASQIPVAIGILLDKKFALDGDNKITIEHKKSDSKENFGQMIADYFASLPTANGDQLIIDQVDEAPKPLNINDPAKKRVENEPNGGGGDSQ